MKILQSVILTIALLSSSAFLSAQETATNFNETVQLDGKNMKKEIKIEVLPSSSTVTVTAKGTIQGGNICIQLCNNKGKGQATLSLCATSDNKAKGSLEEKLQAIPGIWVLHIDNKNASGEVEIEVSQN